MMNVLLYLVGAGLGFWIGWTFGCAHGHRLARREWRRTLTPAEQPGPPDPEKLRRLSDWWCPTCRCVVSPEHVTYDERHDYEGGGCGEHVE